MSQRNASRKRRKARPSGAVAAPGGDGAAKPSAAAAAADTAPAPVENAARAKAARDSAGSPTRGAELAAEAGASAAAPTQDAARRREHAGAVAPPRGRQSSAERKAARAADRAQDDARRRTAAAATAGGPIAPAYVPDLGFAEDGDTGGQDKPTRAQRTEAKNEEVRQSLEPLGKGERPAWVTYGALLAAALGLLNVILYAADVRVQNATFGATVLVGLILLICAAGMWRAIYQAVLAFEVLLGITLTFATISLIAVNSWPGLIRSLAVIGVAGLFFWKLIRAMARLQMPSRPGEQRPG